MMETTISPHVLKAAQLFVSKENTRYFLRAPWVQRIKGRSIIVATDGHTLLVAEDTGGKNYPRRPTQVCAKPDPKFRPPDWASAIRPVNPPPKKPSAVWFNPKYIERIMRAAKLLGVTTTPISLAAPHEPATVHLGATAVAVVMPMRGPEASHMPGWLGETISAPHKNVAKSKAKAEAKRKPRP